MRGTQLFATHIDGAVGGAVSGAGGYVVQTSAQPPLQHFSVRLIAVRNAYVLMILGTIYCVICGICGAGTSKEVAPNVMSDSLRSRYLVAADAFV